MEEFLDGKEYTIGFIGNYLLPILEIDFAKIPGQPQLRDPYVKASRNPFEFRTLPWNEKARSFACHFQLKQ